MKRNRKLIFSGMVILALVLTTGAFAYTYAGATTTTLDASLYDDVYVTQNASAAQPLWESLMPSTVPNSLTLLPSAAGDATALSRYPNSGANWDKVAETMPDDWTTYVYTTSRWATTDLYNLADTPESIPNDAGITKVTVYFRFAGDTTYWGYAAPVIKSLGLTTTGTEQSTYGNIFVTKSQSWMTNPATLKAWTVDDINSLQAGVTIRKESGGVRAACTMVYVVVNYDIDITEGEAPTGNLFDITPHPDFTGDMQVRIYLMNTGALLKAYRYLNLQILMLNSVAPFQLLSLENGVASFNVEGEAATSYTVEVDSGSYSLISKYPSQWAEGWTLTPEFFCEVTQR